MIQILFVVLIALFIFTLMLNKQKEEYMGYGTVFGVHTNPNPNCRLSNDCHPGYYYRSQLYQNMCQPKDHRLTREKVNLVDNCVKSLQGAMVMDHCNDFN